MEPIVTTPAAPTAPAAPAAPSTPAAPSPQTTPAAPAAPAAPEQPPFVMPPEGVNIIKRMRDEMNSIKEEKTRWEREAQLAQEREKLYRANQQPTLTPTPNKEQDMPDFLGDVGDDDIIDGGKVRAALRRQQSHYEKLMDSRLQQAVSRLTPELTHLKLSQSEPNYQELIQKHLPSLVQENPMVADIIKNSQNPLITAVQFAKIRSQAVAAQAPPTPVNKPADLMTEIDRIINNQDKPTNPGLGPSSALSSVSDAQRIANMTPEEFRVYKEQIKSRKPL